MNIMIMIYSYEHIWFLLKAKIFLIHDHIMISDVGTNGTSSPASLDYKNPPLQSSTNVTVPTIWMVAALGQEEQLQPFNDGGVGSPPPPILEAVYY